MNESQLFCPSPRLLHKSTNENINRQSTVTQASESNEDIINDTQLFGLTPPSNRYINYDSNDDTIPETQLFCPSPSNESSNDNIKHEISTTEAIEPIDDIIPETQLFCLSPQPSNDNINHEVNDTINETQLFCLSPRPSNDNINHELNDDTINETQLFGPSPRSSNDNVKRENTTTEDIELNDDIIAETQVFCAPRPSPRSSNKLQVLQTSSKEKLHEKVVDDDDGEIDIYLQCTQKLSESNLTEETETKSFQTNVKQNVVDCNIKFDSIGRIHNIKHKSMESHAIALDEDIMKETQEFYMPTQPFNLSSNQLPILQTSSKEKLHEKHVDDDDDGENDIYLQCTQKFSESNTSNLTGKTKSKPFQTNVKQNVVDCKIKLDSIGRIDNIKHKSMKSHAIALDEDITKETQVFCMPTQPFNLSSNQLPILQTSSKEKLHEKHVDDDDDDGENDIYLQCTQKFSESNTSNLTGKTKSKSFQTNVKQNVVDCKIKLDSIGRIDNIKHKSMKSHAIALDEDITKETQVFCMPTQPFNLSSNQLPILQTSSKEKLHEKHVDDDDDDGENDIYLQCTQKFSESNTSNLTGKTKSKSFQTNVKQNVVDCKIKLDSIGRIDNIKHKSMKSHAIALDEDITKETQVFCMPTQPFNLSSNQLPILQTSSKEKLHEKHVDDDDDGENDIYLQCTQKFSESNTSNLPGKTKSKPFQTNVKQNVVDCKIKLDSIGRIDNIKHKSMKSHAIALDEDITKETQVFCMPTQPFNLSSNQLPILQTSSKEKLHEKHVDDDDDGENDIYLQCTQKFSESNTSNLTGKTKSKPFQTNSIIFTSIPGGKLHSANQNVHCNIKLESIEATNNIKGESTTTQESEPNADIMNETQIFCLPKKLKKVNDMKYSKTVDDILPQIQPNAPNLSKETNCDFLKTPSISTSTPLTKSPKIVRKKIRNRILDSSSSDDELLIPLKMSRINNENCEPLDQTEKPQPRKVHTRRRKSTIVRVNKDGIESIKNVKIPTRVQPKRRATICGKSPIKSDSSASKFCDIDEIQSKVNGKNSKSVSNSKGTRKKPATISETKQKSVLNFDDIDESIKMKLPHVLIDVMKNYQEDNFNETAELYLKQRLERRTKNQNHSTHDGTKVKIASDTTSNTSLSSTNTSKHIDSEQNHFTRSRSSKSSVQPDKKMVQNSDDDSSLKSMNSNLTLRKLSLRQQKQCVLFTRVDSVKYTDNLKSIGCTMAKSMETCTILVTNEINRTIKFMSAIAKGIPIVTTEWLDDCKLKNKYIVPDDNYLIVDVKGERKFNFKLRKSLELARQRLLFNNISFIVTPNTVPTRFELLQLIKCAGGKCITGSKSQPMLTHKIVLCTNEKDRFCWQNYEEKYPNIIRVSAEGIMQMILQQKLNFNDYTLS